MALGKSLRAAAALAVASPAAAADPPPSLDQFEAAMRDLDHRRASKIADLLIARHRLEHPELRPDPLLSGLVGRLFLCAGQPMAALPYLRHADAAGLPAAQRIGAGFARAEAEEALGELPAAAATFERLLSLSLDPGQQLGARIGLARSRLAVDPAAAASSAASLAADAPAGRRWEAELLAAQALSLLGRSAEAEAAARRAWSDALDAPTAAAAPMRIALLRAGLAAAAGRRDALLAMLSSANASANKVDVEIVEAVPVCGDGVTPTDFALFGAYTATGPTQWLMPIAASRPAAASIFGKAIGPRRLLAVTGTAPGGIVFTLRCRTTPSSDYVPAFAADPWIEWFADRGLFFAMAGEADLENINRLSVEIDETASKFGDEHPSTIPLRLSLLQMLENRARTTPDVAEYQVVELRRKIGAALVKAGGAEGFLPDAESESERLRLEKAGSYDQAIAIYRAGMERQVGRLPMPFAYLALREWLNGDKDLPDATRRRVIEALLKRIGGDARDPVRQSLQRRLGGVARTMGDLAAMRAAFSAAGLARDSCGAAETDIALEDHGISDDDYPLDALVPNLEGATVLEIDVGADGRAASGRILLASPSLVFDPLIHAKLPGFRYIPPTERGRPRACRALQQTIRWQMPQEEESGPPTFAPVPQETS